MERKYRERAALDKEIDHCDRGIVSFGKWTEDCDVDLVVYCWLLGDRPLEDDDLQGSYVSRRVNIVRGQTEYIVVGNKHDNMDLVD